MFAFIVNWFLELAITVIEMFPEADVAGISAVFEPAGRVVSWLAQLDAYLPVSEALLMIGMLLSVVTALYTVMFARRLLSLVWPGAGS